MFSLAAANRGPSSGGVKLDGVDRGEEAAVEVVHAGVASGAGGVGVVHLAEEAADEVVGGRRRARHSSSRRVKRSCGQQADVLGEHGDDALEDEAAGADAVFAAEDQRVEGVGDVFGGFAGDLDPVVAEEGLEGAREQEVQRGVAGGRSATGMRSTGSLSWVLKS